MSELALAASLDGAGDGAPVLVLGNSLGTSRAVWDRQAGLLRRHFALLRYELPGHDGASAPPGPYSIEQLGTALVAVLDGYGIDRVAYCGVSLGGMIGMWLAATHPGRVSALGLVCTSAYLPPAQGWLTRAAQVRSHGMASISAASVGRWFTPAFTAAQPEVAAAFAADLERIDVDGYAGCCAAIADMDLRDRLGAITAATLVISGAEDPATPPDHGARIASRIGRSRLMVVRRVSHLANVAAPGEVGHALLGLLGVCGTGAQTGGAA